MKCKYWYFLPYRTFSYLVLQYYHCIPQHYWVLTDPAIRDKIIIATHPGIVYPLQEGEFIVVKDDPKANDWYCAEIRKISADKIEVNYYTTITPAIAAYKDASLKERTENLRSATFLRTWCLNRGTGLPTTTPPTTNHGKLNHSWWGRIPMED